MWLLTGGGPSKDEAGLRTIPANGLTETPLLHLYVVDPLGLTALTVGLVN